MYVDEAAGRQTGIGFLQQSDEDAVTRDRAEELEAAAERADRRGAFADSIFREKKGNSITRIVGSLSPRLEYILEHNYSSSTTD